MSLIKNNNSPWGFNPVLSDLSGADSLTIDRLWKKSGIPSVNISESDEKFEIDFATPGMRKDDFKITVDNGILTVSLELEEEKEEKQKKYTYQEYSYSSFSRSFTLPPNAKEDDVKATYENGILKINVVKNEVAVSKKKEITVA